MKRQQRQRSVKLFNVEVTETLQRTIQAEAETREAAERQTNALWCDGKVVLDYNDFVEASFKAFEPEAQVLQPL